MVSGRLGSRVVIGPQPVRLEDLTLAHDGRPAVIGLSGVFAPGSLTAVAGPNGAGKTTLLRALAGLHAPSRGLIDRGGLVAADVALLPQASQLDRQFPLSCREVVALGFLPRIGLFRTIGGEKLDAAEAALETVGMAGAAKRSIGALSTGQFQRVLFARLLVQDAPVVLLDEPFNAVDERTRDALLPLMTRWHAEGRTVIAVLHDLDLIEHHFPQTLLLARAPVAWGPTASALSEANRRRARLVRDAWDETPDDLSRPAA